MSGELRTLDQNTIAQLVLLGDMKGLNDKQKMDYYSYRCQQAGLDPAAKPFDLLLLNNKLVLYANAGCTQQLTSLHGLSHEITGRELVDGIYCVFCRVRSKDGRSTENMGAVPVESLKGDAKANAMLKATTKAIRRTVLAHCGLGMLDETEVETIQGAQTVEVSRPTLAPTRQEPTLVAAEPKPAWTIETLDAYEATMDRAYQAFQAAGHDAKYNDFADKWRKHRSADPPEKVLPALLEMVTKLESAATKKVPS